MENSSRFFENRECAYFPCHKDMEHLNCLFCYCPLYSLAHCPGSPEYIETEDGRKIRECSNCTFPHLPENYDAIIRFLKKV